MPGGKRPRTRVIPVRSVSTFLGAVRVLSTICRTMMTFGKRRRFLMEVRWAKSHLLQLRSNRSRPIPPRRAPSRLRPVVSAVGEVPAAGAVRDVPSRRLNLVTRPRIRSRPLRWVPSEASNRFSDRPSVVRDPRRSVRLAPASSRRVRTPLQIRWNTVPLRWDVVRVALPRPIRLSQLLEQL